MLSSKSFWAFGLFSNLEFKIPVAALMSFLNYSLNGDMNSAEVIGILVVIDLITGIFKGIKKKRFTSLRMRDTGVKIVLYFLLLVAAHQVTKLFFFPEWTDELIEGYIGAVEIFSILENMAVLGIKPARKIANKLNTKFEEITDDCK